MRKVMKVLIGYDGSSYADAALDDLRRAGLPRECEALVLSVGNPPVIPPLASHEIIQKAFVGESVIAIVEHANKEAAQALHESNELALGASQQLQSYFPSWSVRPEATAGGPASELMRKAEEWQADLIVVGSQGRSAIGRFILGSVSLEVATNSSRSVRIGRRYDAQIDERAPRILVGFDGSPAAEQALRKVLMRPWPQGTEVQIIAVEDGVSEIIAESLSFGGTHVHEDGSITANRMNTISGGQGLRVSAGIRKGDPRDVLITEGQDWDADCIVIGASRAGNTQPGFFANSVATALAADAECSIEIVR
jgi:nucleotide-binding universal stress UspA family protein